MKRNPFDKTEPDVYDHLRHRWHRLKRIHRTDLITALAILSAAILLLMFLDTATRWEDQAEAVQRTQESMIERCEVMESEIAELAEKVDKWGGVK